MKILTLGTLALLTLSLVNCAANEEDRVKGWTNAQARADTLKASHPNFATVIDVQRAGATAAWDAAQKESDKEKKVEALGAATLVLSKLTGRIAEVDSKRETLEEDLKTLSELKILEKFSQRRRDTLNQSWDVAHNVASAMNVAGPKTEAQAMEFLDKQVSALITAQGEVTRTISAVKPKKAKRKSKSKKKKK